jgi:carbon storage regulator
MLVLSRKVGERIYIGDFIRITIVDWRAPKVRVGIEAPPDTTIVREELLNEIPEVFRVPGISADEPIRPPSPLINVPIRNAPVEPKAKP